MLKTIFNHRSIRNFTVEPISDSVLQEILAASTRAPTTGNMQVYSIIVTKDDSVKEKLWEIHFKQAMVKQAPVVLTFCADFNRFNKWCLLRKAEPGYDNFLSFFTAAVDTLLAAQNCVIAAESYGLGTCYLGTTTYNADRIIALLELPTAVVPVTTLIIGHPADMPGLTDRLPVEAVIHYEKYKDYTPASIDQFYMEKENLPLTHHLLIENQLESLAQIFTQKRYTKKDNVVFSKKYLDVITKQGFMQNEL